MKEHEADRCNCDLDGGCACQCPKCLAYIASRARLVRLSALEERLRKADIDIEDFADLVWANIEPTIEAKIEKIAQESLKQQLKGVKLVSAVKWSSIE